MNGKFVPMTEKYRKSIIPRDTLLPRQKVITVRELV